MMKFFTKLLLFAFALVPFFASAQGYYKQGFVINTKGDTLKGYIDLKEWGSNPKDINFKTSLDKSSPQIFTVNNIRYFEIPGIIAYQGFIGSISMDETSIQRLSHERDTSTRTDHVFLKVIQRGKNVILYTFDDAVKRRFYIYDSHSKVTTELIYRIYFVANETNNVNTVSQNAYRQQLLLIAQNFDTYNDNLLQLIEKAEYNDADLIDICRKINNTKKEDITATHKRYFSLFAGAGAGYNTISVDGTFPLYNNTTKSYNSIGPKVSLGVNFYPSPDVGKSVIRLEFAYSSDGYKTIGTLYYYNPSAKSAYSFQQHNISIIPQFQYNIYNTDPFKFYLDAGFSVNVSSYTGNSILNPTTSETTNNFIGLDNRWLSLPLKAGIIVKRNWDLSLTYTFKNSISDNVGQSQGFDYSLKMQTVQAQLSYIF